MVNLKQFLKLICLHILTYTNVYANFSEVGCYSIENLIDFQRESLPGPFSVDKCVELCQKKGKKLAGLASGNTCLCGQFYRGGSNPPDCTLQCSSTAQTDCGGPSHASLYEASASPLGPPQNLEIIKASETGLQIKWEPPRVGLSGLQHYSVSATPEFSYNQRSPPLEKQYKFSNLTKTSYLDGLSAGTKYKIVVKGHTDKQASDSASLLVWTVVGVPERPQVPELLSKMDDSMVVQLQEVVAEGGPISSYEIVVVDETLPVLIDFDVLLGFEAASKQNYPFYIAARILPENFDPVFKVGDGKMYGPFYNAPLSKGVDYHVLLGVTSTINQTKSSYSLSTHSQHESSDLLGHHSHSSHEFDSHSHESSDGTVVGLSVAIGVLACIFLSSLAVYFGLRFYLQKKGRRSLDQQELAVHPHTPDMEPQNGFIAGQYGEEEPPPEYYRLLRSKVSILSPHHLTTVSDLGTGSFGQVKKALILDNHLGIRPRNALIHQITDSTLPNAKKSQMLKMLDNHIKLASHHNVISLLGLVEELNLVTLVFEYEHASLKGLLEESRALQHYPVYAEKNRRFSTLPETQVLTLLVDVARGLSYLHSHNVVHGNIRALSVVVKDQTQAKISDFGLLKYHSLSAPDYCRWQAPEYLKTNNLAAYSDIWSLGCLIWECVTLGGTPYADVRTQELENRIIRGLRLLQPQYVSDELYQVMLLCWQNDTSERPSASQVESLLQTLINDDIKPHLLFTLYQSFAYEPHAKHLEFID